MHEKLQKKTEESIDKILKEGITTNNLDHLYKLAKINHIAKEGENTMRYNEYNEYRDYNGRGPGHGSYGEYNRGYNEYNEGYNARGRDSKYRGYDHLDRMSGEYGRYMESRERYGAGSQESDKSFHYMVKALEDFIKVLYEEAEGQQQKQQLRQALQNSMM